MDPAGTENTICEESSSSLTLPTLSFLPSNVVENPAAPPMNKLDVCDVVLCVNGTPVKAAAAETSGRRRTCCFMVVNKSDGCASTSEHQRVSGGERVVKSTYARTMDRDSLVSVPRSKKTCGFRTEATKKVQVGPKECKGTLITF